MGKNSNKDQVILSIQMGGLECIPTSKRLYIMEKRYLRFMETI